MRPSARPESTALILLRCIELGLSMDDLDHLTLGMVYEIFVERGNDKYEWDEIATADDIANF